MSLYRKQHVRSPQLRTSHRLPPFAKHVVDEFGHGFGAAVAPPVGSVLQVLHHLPDELREEVGNVLVALSRRNLLEVTAVLLRQGAAFLLLHLTGMAQVLLVAHQTHGNIHVPETKRNISVERQMSPMHSQ